MPPSTLFPVHNSYMGKVSSEALYLPNKGVSLTGCQSLQVDHTESQQRSLNEMFAISLLCNTGSFAV